MTDHAAYPRPIYEIRVQGHLDASYTHWLEGLSLYHDIVEGKPITVLSGPLVDQAALYGVLNRLNAKGLVLLGLLQLP